MIPDQINKLLSNLGKLILEIAPTIIALITLKHAKEINEKTIELTNKQITYDSKRNLYIEFINFIDEYNMGNPFKDTYKEIKTFQSRMKLFASKEVNDKYQELYEIMENKNGFVPDFYTTEPKNFEDVEFKNKLMLQSEYSVKAWDIEKELLELMRNDLNNQIFIEYAYKII